ncbi:hypothetical protein Lalb_Chr24g0402201 [Lupinus albus]|uniref:Uncharacterized protein n=1 Tax=Lupinus albus TaxID=3870 RepID=A0A6A4NIL2_LUPAL|nr:hypothetical protein Lalb_Chr24g0402201 [Lupinus albus]
MTYACKESDSLGLVNLECIQTVFVVQDHVLTFWNLGIRGPRPHIFLFGIWENVVPVHVSLLFRGPSPRSPLNVCTQSMKSLFS